MIKNLMTALALIVVSSVATASTFVVDQHNDSAGPNQGYTNLDFLVGQSFSPTANTLDHVELQLNAQYSSTATVHVDILDFVGGTVLGSSDTHIFSGQGTAGINIVHFEFSSIDISAYSSLFMQIVADSGFYGAFLSGGFGIDSYAGGTAYQGIDSKVASDLWFRTGSTDGGVSAVPIPAALFMFAPALLGFLGLRRKTRV